MSSRYIALLFCGRIGRPTVWQMEKEAESTRRNRLSADCSARHTTVSIQEEFGTEIGVVPSLWQCTLNVEKLLRAPIYPSFYRTNPYMDDSKIAKQAVERFDWCISHPSLLHPIEREENKVNRYSLTSTCALQNKVIGTLRSSLFFTPAA
jgi:hypothetical protein